MKKIIENNETVKDLIEICAFVVEREDARACVRNLCRVFGGNVLYISKKENLKTASKFVYDAFAEIISEDKIKKILEKLSLIYGETSIYIPLERTGFRADIAREVYENYNGKNMEVFTRKYNISAQQVYRMYYAGRDVKKQERLQTGLFL